ncbi:kynureninase [Altererythrobacter sp. JGD-16]|uniref:Kynureninase n=2 Tax=Altererythrobacter lutimaris TaxID=2743979 RepID=A0A850HER8_9SPHN|nr:kynureninase [Altererythrobacter lutimaris]
MEAVEAMDAADPLQHFRDEFVLRDGLIYLDGNSLGALPKATLERIQQTVLQEWGQGLITSWTEAEWIEAPRRIGDKIAQLIGAEAGEVVACDSTSVNIFKALSAALSLKSDRTVMLTEAGNFPTDGYMMQGLAKFGGAAYEFKAVPRDRLFDALNDDVAVLLLTHVHYKTAAMHDMAEVTRRAHDAGALVVWDLSHSTGAVEVDLNGANADFAVGCGYKYLNGGPGAPAFLYAAKRHHHAQPILSGWFGHARPFGFEEDYEAAAGIDRFQCGTPPILGMAALESGVDQILRADPAAVRQKSIGLVELLIKEMEPLCKEFGFDLSSPTNPTQLGSHVAYSHPNAYAMVQALKARDVIGDFRTPDTIRFGITPLYLRFTDMVEAARRLRLVCEQREWERAEYQTLAAVT